MRLLDLPWQVESSSAVVPLAYLAYLLAFAADHHAPASHHRPSQVDLGLAPFVAAVGLSPSHDLLQAGHQLGLSAGSSWADPCLLASEQPSSPGPRDPGLPSLLGRPCCSPLASEAHLSSHHDLQPD